MPLCLGKSEQSDKEVWKLFRLTTYCSSNEIPPSQEVYGATPIIIPSSPTQEIEGIDVEDAEVKSHHDSDKRSSSSSGNLLDIMIDSTMATDTQLKNRNRKEKTQRKKEIEEERLEETGNEAEGEINRPDSSQVQTFCDVWVGFSHQAEVLNTGNK